MKRLVYLASVCLTFVACGDSTGPGSVAGRYALVSLNGAPLPAVFFQVLENKVEITAGHIQLNRDGTCSASATFQSTVAGLVETETSEDTCTWTQNHPAFAITFSDGSTDAGSLIDGTISITSEDFVLVYRK